MTDAKLLQQVRSSEKSGRVARRLDMLIVLFNMKGVFAMAAATYSCDPRTVALWHGRMPQNTDVFGDIRSALADMPRSGRPTKIPRRLLAKAEAWCVNRAFTPTELCDYMEDISGVRLSMSQTRRYAVQWGYSRKKTSPMHVNRAAIEDVESWQESITRIVAQYAKLGYAIATMDESNYTRCRTVCTILGKGGIAHIHDMVRRPSEIFHVLYNGHGWQVLFQPHHEDGHDKLSGTHRESIRKGGKDGAVFGQGALAYICGSQGVL